MAIISQETFEKFTDEEKKKVRKLYDTPLKTEVNNWYPGRFVELEHLFDKESLQPENKIKTWEDFLKEFHKGEDWNHKHELSDLSLYGMTDKVKAKIIATAKIAKLIELGYDGMVTDEEWKNIDLPKYTIIPCNVKDELRIDLVYTRNDKQFTAFHSQELAEEFLSYPENVKLLEQYFLI